MAEAREEVEVTYTDAVIEEAATSFVRHFFKTTYGRVWVLACVINIAAFALAFFFGVRDPFMLFVVGLIATLGPIYLGAFRFLYPRKFATALKQRLQPKANVTISSSGFGVAANGRSFALPWSDIKSVLEAPEYFVLIISKLAFTVIPKNGLSLTSQQLIREVGKRRAA